MRIATQRRWADKAYKHARAGRIDRALACIWAARARPTIEWESEPPARAKVKVTIWWVIADEFTGYMSSNIQAGRYGHGRTLSAALVKAIRRWRLKLRT